MADNILAIDIGGTFTKFGIVSRQGEILAHSKIETLSGDTFETYAKRVQEACEDLAKENNLEFVKVGVGAPNANHQSGQIEHPPNLGWDIAPVREVFKNLFNKEVFFDNDADAATLGEAYFGFGKGLDNFITITLGTGVGTGFFCQGKILKGGNGMAGEGGHITIVPNGRICGCGGAGHLEAYCSGPGIKKSYFEKYNIEKPFREICSDFLNSEQKAVEVFQETAKLLALAISQFETLFGPEKIIIGGGVSTAGENFLKMIVEEKFALIINGPGSLKKDDIVISPLLSGDGALLGAAALTF